MVNVGLAKGDTSYRAVRDALELIRDDVRIPADRPVLVKPNMVSGTVDLAATPVEAVRATMDFLASLGVERFIVGEGTAGPAGHTMGAFERHGYFPLRDHFDVEFRNLNIDADWLRLEALGPEPDERERFPVAQAVGDAYQNLAYLEYHLRQRMGLSREYFSRSIATDSGDRQQMQEYIDAIDGKRDPMPEYPSATRLPPPEESRPEPAPLAWESSLSLALARAQNERRPLVVYYRGSGLGLAVPYLDRAVTSEAAAEVLAGCVCVLADRIRHTFVDRRRDGAPVLCPRYGVLTCGEHAAAEADFAAWWSQSNGGAAPGESEEGLFLIPWDAEAPGRPAYQLSGADLAARLEGALPSADLDALTARALGGEDRIAAHVLLSSSGRAGRQRAEALLFGEGTNEAARANLIGALAQAMAMDPAWAGLLPRLLSQIADEDLALRAVGAWPAGLDPAPLIHASQWHPSPRVAEAATARLAEDWPGEATQRFLAARELLQ